MGHVTDHRVTCTACDATISASASPSDACPVCGNTTGRKIEITIASQVTMHSSLRIKGETPGAKRPFIEQWIGADWSHRLGRFVDKLRAIDRRGDQYLETIRDPETGEVIHHEEHPLSEHRERGSAKPL